MTAIPVNKYEIAPPIFGSQHWRHYLTDDDYRKEVREMRIAIEDVDEENETASVTWRPVFSAGLKDVVEKSVAEQAKVREAPRPAPTRQVAPQPYGGD